MIANTNLERTRFVLFCLIFVGLWRKVATFSVPLVVSTTSVRTLDALQMVDASIQHCPWRKHPTPNDQHRLEDVFLGDDKDATIDDSVVEFRGKLPFTDLVRLFKSVERHDRSLEIDNK